MRHTTSKQALLITGGSGTVGRPLAEYFVSGGYRVYLLARHPEAAALEIGERGRPVIMDLEAFVLKGLAAFHGILFISGTFEATGTATYYGSVITRTGVVQEVTDGSAATPDLFWDAAILDDWPPAGWPLPRVMVTQVWTEAR